MKKVLSLVCVLAMVATCLFVFASCGATPNSDPAAAEAALKEAGYTVSNTTVDGVGVVTGYKSLTDMVTINYCKDEATAEEMYEKIEAEYEVTDEAQDAADELGIELPEFEYGISGTMVWVGTPDAVAAAQ